jgi:hypothetical protein
MQLKLRGTRYAWTCETPIPSNCITNMYVNAEDATLKIEVEAGGINGGRPKRNNKTFALNSQHVLNIISLSTTNKTAAAGCQSIKENVYVRLHEQLISCNHLRELFPQTAGKSHRKVPPVLELVTHSMSVTLDSYKTPANVVLWYGRRKRHGTKIRSVCFFI